MQHFYYSLLYIRIKSPVYNSINDTTSIALYVYYIVKAAPALSDDGRGVTDPLVQLNVLKESGHSTTSYPPIKTMVFLSRKKDIY